MPCLYSAFVGMGSVETLHCNVSTVASEPACLWNGELRDKACLVSTAHPITGGPKTRTTALIEQNTLRILVAGGGKSLIDGGKSLIGRGKWLIDGGKPFIDGGKSFSDGGKSLPDGGKWLPDRGKSLVG